MTEHQSSESAQDAFLANTFGLAGKTAVVTGGGGTLCGAMAKGFALAGANVVLWGRGQTSLDETSARSRRQAPTRRGWPRSWLTSRTRARSRRRCGRPWRGSAAWTSC